jgi:serine/threonine protein phosphatase PrpC
LDKTACWFCSWAILAVADGAEGRSGGAEASQMAIDFINSQASSIKSQKDCERLITEIDRRVANDAVAGETTVVVVVVGENEIAGASCGDSGAWVITNSIIDDLTAHQVRKPFLGTGVAMPVGFARTPFIGTVLVATDGLLKYTSRESIAAVVTESTLEAVAERLVSLVRYKSGALPDDVGIALCRSMRS